MGRKHFRDSIKRRKPQLTPRARILIVCEGKVTEPTYFEEMARQERARVEVVVKGHSGVPKTIVERAVQLKKEADNVAKHEKDDFLKYDEVWCVFDIDEHPNIPDAIQQAKAHGLGLAISNPCFELWVLLHFQDQRQHLERNHVAEYCRRHIPRYKKQVPFGLLSEKYTEALKRAVELERWQKQMDRPLGNPSTGVHNLTERIKGLGHAAVLASLQKSLQAKWAR